MRKFAALVVLAALPLLVTVAVRAATTAPPDWAYAIAPPPPPVPPGTTPPPNPAASDTTLRTVPGSSKQYPRNRMVLDGAKRRGTFRDRTKVLDIRFREPQIMRTRFNRHVHAASTRVGSQRNAAPAADVNDVQCGARFARELQRPPNRLGFGGNRTRFQEVADTAITACSG